MGERCCKFKLYSHTSTNGVVLVRSISCLSRKDINVLFSQCTLSTDNNFLNMLNFKFKILCFINTRKKTTGWEKPCNTHYIVSH